MKVNEFVRGVEVWRSIEENKMLAKIKEPTLFAVFDEREKTIIESLIRKSLLIKVQGKDSTYVYPNV
jgi:hypothetical protein